MLPYERWLSTVLFLSCALKAVLRLHATQRCRRSCRDSLGKCFPLRRYGCNDMWRGGGAVFPVSDVLRLLITQLPPKYIIFKCRKHVNKVKILRWGRNGFPQWAHGLVLSPLPCNQMSHHQCQCFRSPVKKLPYSSSK
jgi:hypothetical protein